MTAHPFKNFKIKLQRYVISTVSVKLGIVSVEKRQCKKADIKFPVKISGETELVSRLFNVAFFSKFSGENLIRLGSRRLETWRTGP